MARIVSLMFVLSLIACGGMNSTLRDALSAQYPACSDTEQVRVFDRGTVEGADLVVCGVSRRFVSFDGVTWTEDLRFAARAGVQAAEVAEATDAVEAESPAAFLASDDEPEPGQPEPTPADPANEP